ncbi:MAG TPA: hypothetical protein VFZ70_11485 [Euzebyales bacterium]
MLAPRRTARALLAGDEVATGTLLMVDDAAVGDASAFVAVAIAQ